MTVFVVYLLKLRGDEQWEEYGDDWMKHTDRVAELQGVGGWDLLQRLREQEGKRQLDWGAHLYPVSKQELLDVYGEHPSGLDWFKDRDREQFERLQALDAGDYALALVEVY